MYWLFWMLSAVFWVLAAMGLTNEKIFPKQQKWLAVVFILMTAGWITAFLLSLTAR